MIILFLCELLILFFLSRRLTQEVSFLLYTVFRSRKVAVWVMAIIFLPGTIIHEFSHAIMAKFLFVYVGRMELMPQLHGESLKLGSVMVGKTDFIRNFLIGIAPFITGTSLLLSILYASFANNILGFNFFTIGILYVIFVIANTMYSSRKDMEGVVPFLIFTLIMVTFLYFIGVRIPGLSWETVNSGGAFDFFRMSSIYIGVPLTLNIAIILFATIVRR